MGRQKANSTVYWITVEDRKQPAIAAILPVNRGRWVRLPRIHARVELALFTSDRLRYSCGAADLLQGDD